LTISSKTSRQKEPTVELLIISLILVLLGVLAVSANELGVDSRDGSDDHRRPNYPVGLR